MSIAERNIDNRIVELSEDRKGAVKMEWISTNEKLPPRYMPCLAVVNDNGEKRIAILTRDRQYSDKAPWTERNTFEPFVYTDKEVTHWMPLPKLPKEEEK